MKVHFFTVIAVIIALSSCDLLIPPDEDVRLEDEFSLSRSVFEIPVYGSQGVSDATLDHVAVVMAEYLDSNEDGSPDNPQVVARLRTTAAMVIFLDEADEESFFRDLDGEPNREIGGVRQTEVNPAFDLTVARSWDATLEEVLHLITDHGYAEVYPRVFGETENSEIANAMDTARGGRFTSVPASYPADAWYTYDDDSCDYACQVTEYTYWGITTYLGMQSQRDLDISHEWRPETRTKLEETDSALIAILENTDLSLPTEKPDGAYAGN